MMALSGPDRPLTRAREDFSEPAHNSCDHLDGYCGPRTAQRTCQRLRREREAISVTCRMITVRRMSAPCPQLTARDQRCRGVSRASDGSWTRAGDLGKVRVGDQLGAVRTRTAA
jgi:hypothetical protein